MQVATKESSLPSSFKLAVFELLPSSLQAKAGRALVERAGDVVKRMKPSWHGHCPVPNLSWCAFGFHSVEQGRSCSRALVRVNSRERMVNKAQPAEPLASAN